MPIPANIIGEVNCGPFEESDPSSSQPEESQDIKKNIECIIDVVFYTKMNFKTNISSKSFKLETRHVLNLAARAWSKIHMTLFLLSFFAR